MGGVMVFAVGAACLMVAGILAYGIRGFGTGKMTPQKQNKVMQWRIAGQAIAIVLILATVAILKAD